MIDMGLLHYFLGIEVRQYDDWIFISQEKYCRELLKRFKMGECKEAVLPMEVGQKLSVHDSSEIVDAT